MTFFARLARFLFWLLIVSWGVALLRRIAAWALQRSAPHDVDEPAQASVARKLHRDPVCGTHVSDQISVPLLEAGETLHFCSEECRTKYANLHRPAVNE
jgi:YHS domain-containing protein